MTISQTIYCLECNQAVVKNQIHQLSDLMRMPKTKLQKWIDTLEATLKPLSVKQPETQNESANEMRGDVLETVCSLLVYLSQSPRPTLLLDALSVLTGLILTDRQTAVASLSRKHGVTCHEFEDSMAEISRKLNLPSQSAISPLGRAQMAGCSIVPPCPQKPATMNPVTCYAHAGES